MENMRYMAHGGVTGRLVVGAAWVAWFVALMATPFFLAEPYRGPILTGSYAWVALGLLIGCLLGSIWNASAIAAMREKARKALLSYRWLRAALIGLFAAGWLLAIAISAAELVSLPVALQGDPEILYDVTPLHSHAEGKCFFPLPISLVFDTPWRLLVEEYEKIGLSFSALLCSLAPCLIGIREPEANRRLAERDSGETGTMAPMAFALSFVMGFSKAPLEFFVFHREVGATSFTQACDAGVLWAQYDLTPAAALPGITAVLLAATWCFGLLNRVHRCHTSTVDDGAKSGILLFPRWNKTCCMLAVYAFGTIVWNFLSRSVLIYDKMPFWGWLLLSSLYVIAVLGLVAESCDGRSATRRPHDKAKKGSADSISSRDVYGPSPLEPVPEIELPIIFGEGKAEALTERERQALCLMLAGATSTQSAAVMDIGASTVRAYLQRAYRKLGLSNGEEAVIAYKNHRKASLRARAHGRQEAAVAMSKTTSFSRIIKLLVGSLGVMTAAWALTPIGVSGDAIVAAGSPLVFGLGAGFMLFGLAEWCGVKLVARRNKPGVLIACAAALWGVLAFLRLSLVAGVSYAPTEGSTFIVAFCAAFVLAWAVKGHIASKGNISDGDYRLAASLEVSVWLMAIAIFTGLFVQMAWTDLGRPVAATLLVASWMILPALLLVGRLVGVPRMFAVVLLSIGLMATAAGRGSLVMPTLALLALGVLVVRVPLLPSRLGLVSAALGIGLAFGRIATNLCNDLMEYYTWVFDNLDPSDVLFPMIGFAAAMVLLVVVAYVQVKLYREIKGEYDLWRTLRFFGTSELTRAEAYLVAKGLSPAEVSVGIGILQGYSAMRISEEAYLSLGAVNNACLMLYRRLGVNSRAQFADAIKSALDLGDGTQVLH